jgi:hypothetical protein
MNMRNMLPLGKLSLTNRGEAVRWRPERGVRIDEGFAEGARSENEHTEQDG